MSQTRLNALVREWAKRLRLDGWRIVAEFVSYLDDEADINIDRHRKEAVVRLSRSTNQSVVRRSSDEENLVHELLHIPIDAFSPSDEKSLEHDAMEAFINDTAEALVALKYAKGAKRDR